jgi:hypothetical protein
MGVFIISVSVKSVMNNIEAILIDWFFILNNFAGGKTSISMGTVRIDHQ